MSIKIVLAGLPDFFLNHGSDLTLITNDHVVSGLGRGDRSVISETGAVPQWLRIIAHVPATQQVAEKLVETQLTQVDIPLYGDTDKCLDPYWVSHPTLGHQVDVVAICITEGTFGPNPPPVLELPVEPSIYTPMEKVFVVGFPLHEDDSPNSFSIYKAASIASEPNFLGERPYIFIDGKTKPGMSGSPVILAHEPHVEIEGSQLIIKTGITELIGVYSGR